MRTLLIGLLILALQPAAAHAFGKKKPTVLQPLTNSIKVREISMPSENSMAGAWPSTVSCPVFKGTHAGNEITFDIQAAGGDGEYFHTLVYNITKSYKLEQKGEGQLSETRKGNGKISITLPQLDDQVSFVQQNVFLITKDEGGRTTTTSLNFLVARPVILMPSKDPTVKAKECFERYAPRESTVGVLSNGSTAVSTISIKQGTSNLWSSTKGWQFGVFVSPLSWLGLGNLVSLNMSYFTQVSKQTIETVEIASGYTLNPGDYMQVYVQPTRYVSAYDATLLNPCGQTTKLKGAYLFQWWGFSYQIYPVNPFEKARIPLEAVGVPALNSCPKELSPLSDDDDVPLAADSSGFNFRRTNQ